MKIKNLVYITALAATMGAGFSSCKKSAFDINKNPNEATDSTVSYDVILPAALHSTGAVVGTQFGFLQNWLGFWARSGTYAPNVIEETYQITTNFGTGIWNGLYDNLYDYQVMQIKATQAGADFYQGIARIMKAHNFQMLVDVYGNVPYFEALKGNANPTPKYDNGQAIYQDLLKQIDTAITLINGAAMAQNKDIADNDIMFGGDKGKWVRFGNTLKLRMLVHLMNGGIFTPTQVVPGFDIPGEITKAINAGGFLGAGENAQINPGYKSDKPNPFYNTYKSTETGAPTANNIYYRANEWGIGYYTYNGDPRRSRFYAAGPNGYTGVAYGLPPVTENAAGELAAIGPGLGGSSTASQPIMTAAESFLLQAEARIRGFLTTGATAETLLTTGIQESFSFIGVPDPINAANTYIANNATYSDVDINAASAGGPDPGGGLFTIISQKWFALNGLNTLEVWSDFRRVNYSATRPTFLYGVAVGYDPGPPISVSPQNTATTVPIRLLYPQTEYNYNAANVGGQGTINQFTSRVFWDLQ